MFGQVVAFLAVATSVAFASTSGCCYPGYGSYVNALPALTTGVSNGFYAPGILSTACATPVVTSTLPFRAPVGCPEVVSSCENSLVAPVVDAGVVSSGSLYYRSGCGLGYGCGSVLGGYGTGVIATAC